MSQLVSWCVYGIWVEKALLWHWQMWPVRLLVGMISCQSQNILYDKIYIYIYVQLVSSTFHVSVVYPIVLPPVTLFMCSCWTGQIKAERHSRHSVSQWYFQQTAETVKRSRQRGWLPTWVRQHAACCVRWLISFDIHARCCKYEVSKVR